IRRRFAARLNSGVRPHVRLFSHIDSNLRFGSDCCGCSPTRASVPEAVRLGLRIDIPCCILHKHILPSSNVLWWKLLGRGLLDGDPGHRFSICHCPGRDLAWLRKARLAGLVSYTATCFRAYSHGVLEVDRMRPNNAFKPTPHRVANHMAGTACHVAHAPLRRGLTLVLGLTRASLAGKCSQASYRA